MSWSDLFYPGNPERRQKVVQLYTKIITLMEANFKRTNMLIDVLHEHLPGKEFSKIYVDHQKTIRENCNIIVPRLEEIQAYLEEKKLNMKDKLEPDLYGKLMDTDIKFAEKLEFARKITAASIGGTAFLAGITVIVTVSQALKGVATTFTTLAAATAATVVVAVIFMGIDMIVSAIIGAIERDKLEKAIEELEETLHVFEPASDEYTIKIERAIIIIEGF